MPWLYQDDKLIASTSLQHSTGTIYMGDINFVKLIGFFKHFDNCDKGNDILQIKLIQKEY